MAKTKPSSFLTDGFLFVGGAAIALLFVWALWFSFNPKPNLSLPSSSFENSHLFAASFDCPTAGDDLVSDSPAATFYDDKKVGYGFESKVETWDEKRREWLQNHPSFLAGGQNRVLMVSGSQPTPCRNPIGDHLLLRFFKNKVDYCRLHGYDIFYNNVLLQPKMFTFWAKLPVVRAAMIAHPEAEWIWWVDSDAAITDMEFKLPLDRYKNHNLVVHGWAKLIYESKSWVSINAGVFLMRNCQWSLDLMDVWVKMGPQSPEYEKWGKIQRETFKDKTLPDSDDQSGLIYLLLIQKEKWADKVYTEGEYYFEGYWVEIIEALENITDKYNAIEKEVPRLRRRHAEKVSEAYGSMREEYLKEAGNGRGSWRRPFITHFTGCQPCSGNHNQDYAGETCWNGMQRALSFADNQVLRKYGFIHPNVLDSSSVSPLPFDYPAS